MTGYGRGESSSDRMHVKAELRSLNSKFFDLNVRIPVLFRERELIIRNLISEKLERGKVDFTLSIEYKGGNKLSSINTDLAKAYFAELKPLAESLQQPTDNLLNTVLRIPEVVAPSNDAVSEADWRQVNEAIEKAVIAIDQFRISEGETLSKVFESGVKNILQLLAETETLEGERLENQKSKIKKQLNELLTDDSYDKNRFEQELIYYIERMDFSEEKVRLRSHCDFFIQTLLLKENSGRKLNFISQEMGREINTLGSKANHAGIQKIVVGMKDELEKIKEQLLNIL